MYVAAITFLFSTTLGRPEAVAKIPSFRSPDTAGTRGCPARRVVLVDDRYRTLVHRLDGTTERVSGTPTLNTKRAAEQAERAHVDRVLRPPVAEPVKNEAPMLAAFGERFLETYAKANNKPSEQASKRLIMKRHLRPVFGTKRLDQIGRETSRPSRPGSLQP